MSELNEANLPPKKSISRRDFLLGGIKAGVGVLAGSGLIREALTDRTLKEGLQTPVAVFYPIYEKHFPGPAESSYSHYPPFNAIFIELLIRDFPLCNLPPGLLIPALTDGKLSFSEKNKEITLNRLGSFLSKLAKDRTPLVFLDVMPLPFDDNF